MNKIFYIIFSFFITSCVTPVQQHTEYQYEIRKRQEQSIEDAKTLLTKAATMVTIKSGTLDVQRIENLLNSVQSILDVRVSDSNKIKDLEGKELDTFIDEILKQDEKNKKIIKELEDKNDKAVSELVTSDIKLNTLEKEQKRIDYKFYMICTVIITIISGLVYLIPSNLLKKFFK